MDCALLGVPVVASNVLLGGLVSKSYVGKPAGPSFTNPRPVFISLT